MTIFGLDSLQPRNVFCYHCLCQESVRIPQRHVSTEWTPGVRQNESNTFSHVDLYLFQAILYESRLSPKDTNTRDFPGC